MDKRIIFLILMLVFSSLVIVAAQEKTSVLDATVCCEETNSGLFCQDVLEKDCKPDSRKPPTACSSTAFCKGGWCVDNKEGNCLDNVAQVSCNENLGGTWFAEKPAQCDLGCCILGDQASFVTLTRCKRLSGFYGLKTNFNSDIIDEGQCILTARAEEKGACVFTEDFERTCKFTTRSDCTAERFQDTTPSDVGSGGVDNTVDGDVKVESNGEESGGILDGLIPVPSGEEEGSNVGDVTGAIVGIASAQEGDNGVEFFAGKLCSAEELGTNCGRTKDTTCVEGREEVYFVDTCGNPANIYDKGKVNDNTYWSNIVDREDSCNPDSNNENSQSCGNCNYLLGSYCRVSTSDNANPTYGANVCQSLNCEDPKTGELKLHGESWCVYDVSTDFEFRAVDDEAQNIQGLLQETLGKLNAGGVVGTNFLGGDGAPVGSRYYRMLCNNGQVISEPCADFRQEECIENTRETSLGTFTEAACRVNRWQDCTGQRNKQDCMNTDRRDCKWLDGIEYILMGTILGIDGGGGNGSGGSLDGGSLAGIKQRAESAIQELGGVENVPRGACVPEIPPGLNFWGGEEAAGICGQANAICPVTYEKGLVGGDWECVEHCECLEKELELKRAQVCMAMGDCGPKVNIVGVKGRGIGYKITQQDVDDD